MLLTPEVDPRRRCSEEEAPAGRREGPSGEGSESGSWAADGSRCGAGDDGGYGDAGSDAGLDVCRCDADGGSCGDAGASSFGRHGIVASSAVCVRRIGLRVGCDANGNGGW